ncbi:mechanosensitive ion channel family protein [Gilvimarinus chinensis]|uniref:mechanosensitive ion channel family protein n=1 Tax=Gilvimarinus chinensis TaxID=396005 RepID=UPI000371C5DD|nr:mechanosensitive ion channel family protein [Gilvimarinus chinensis]
MGLSCWWLAGLAQGQEVTLKDIVDANALAEEEVAHLQRSRPLATPLGAVLLLREAGRKEQWEAMAQYADLRYLPDDVKAVPPAELMRKLTLVWEQYQILDMASISNEETGKLDDGLPPYRELLGSLRGSSKTYDMYLQRVPDEDGHQVWKLSNASVAQIPELWSRYGYPSQLEILERWLPNFKLFHMHNWQVVALILLIVVAWLGTGIIKWVLLKLVERFSIYGDTMQRLIRKPLRRFLFFLFLNWSVFQLGLPLKARVIFDTGFLAYLAGLFLVLGVVEFFRAVYIGRAIARDETYAPGFVTPLVTTLKVIIIIFAVLFWLESAGYNMATVLTGLGIGSLAVALAAQKTLENVFGAFTLFIARPIKPGDFCCFGNVVGTVEEIGLRSTVLRKLDRTLVNVPNSLFSAQVLENFTEIDQRLYRQSFYLSLDVTSQKLQAALEEMNKVLEEHPRVLETSRRVRFEAVERQGFLLQANAYINTADFSEFLPVAESLNLQMLQVLESLQIPLAHWTPAFE